MKIIKITIIALMFFLIGSILSVFFFLGKEDYSDGLIWTIHQLSDYQIEAIDITSIDIASTSTIVARNIKVQRQATDQKIIADYIEIQFSLMSLFLERFDIEKLIVRDSKIVLNNQVHSFNIDSDDLLIPTIEHAQLINVYISCECQNSKQLDLYLEDVSIFDNKHGEVTVSGVGEFEQSPFHLSGNLGAESQLKQHEQLFPIKLALEFSDFSFLIQGNLDDPLELEGFDLKFTGDATELSVITQHFFIGLPLLGKAHLDFALKGDWDDLRVSDLNATLENNSTIDIGFKGAIDDVLGHFEAEFHMNGSVGELELIEQLVADKAPVTFTNIKFDGLVAFNQYSGSIKNLNLQLVDDKGINMNVDGSGQFKVGREFTFSDIELDVAIATTSSSTMAFHPIVGKQVPELGKVSANARLAFSDKAFSLSDIDIIVGSKEQLKIMVSGKSDEFIFGSDIDQIALDLNIELSGQNIEHIKPIRDQVNNIAGIDVLTAKLNLSGSLNKSELNIENMMVHHLDGIMLQTHGKIKLGDLRQAEPIDDFSLQLDSHILKMETLSPWVETKLPLLGELRLKTKIQGNGERFSLQDVQVNVGDKSSVWMKLEGQVEDVYYAEDLSWSGMSMKAEFQAWDSHQIASYLDMPLPDIEKTYGHYKISGNSASLTVTDLNFTVLNHSGLRLIGTGLIKNSGLLSNSKLSGVYIDLIADADSNTSLDSIIKQELPDIGKLHVTARLIDRHNQLGLEDIVLTVGNSDNDIIRATGHILNILDDHRLNLSAQMETEASVILEHIFDKEIPEMGVITANVSISNHDGSLGIEILEVSGSSAGLYQLTATGIFDDFQIGDELKFDLNVAIANPQLLGHKLGYEIADFEPVDFVGHIEGSNEKSIFEGDINIGKTHFESDITASYIDGRPRLNGKLYAKHLNLKDLGMHHEKFVSDTAANKDIRLFSEEILPFYLINNVDLDFHISADEIQGTQFNIDTADAHIKIHNDILEINSASLIFDGGFVQVDASIAVDGKHPEINFDVQANDVDIGQLVSQFIENHSVDGDLTTHINVTGSGYSLADITASLDGDIAVALDNGVLHEANLALLNVDFLGWFFDHLIQKKQTDIHCAMSHHQINSGLAELKMLMIAAPDLEASGEGNINLKDETIDLTIYTDNKSIFKPRTPISVKGNLSKPTVTVLPSINTLTSLIISIVPQAVLADVALSKFWGLLNEDDVNSKCEAFLP